MSSPTLKIIMQHWNSELEGVGSVDLPFNIEKVCLEIDELFLDNKRLNHVLEIKKETIVNLLKENDRLKNECERLAKRQ